MPQAQPSVTAPVFADGAIPQGGRYEQFFFGTIQTGGTQRGWYACETINPRRPALDVARPNPIGGPNGFSLVAQNDTMTIRAQVFSQSTPTLKRGDWFQDDFDPSTGTVNIGQPTTGGVNEYFVVVDTSDRYDLGAYWAQDVTLKKIYFPAQD